MEIFEFKDVKTVPDPIQDYTNSLRTSGTPLIIDNGNGNKKRKKTDEMSNYVYI